MFHIIVVYEKLNLLRIDDLHQCINKQNNAKFKLNFIYFRNYKAHVFKYDRTCVFRRIKRSILVFKIPQGVI